MHWPAPSCKKKAQKERGREREGEGGGGREKGVTRGNSGVSEEEEAEEQAC